MFETNSESAGKRRDALLISVVIHVVTKLMNYKLQMWLIGLIDESIEPNKSWWVYKEKLLKHRQLVFK